MVWNLSYMEKIELNLKQAALLKLPSSLLSSSLMAKLRENTFILACNLNHGHFASQVYS